jgi:hypothetical protein
LAGGAPAGHERGSDEREVEKQSFAPCLEAFSAEALVSAFSFHHGNLLR